MAETRKINILTPDVYNKIAAGEVVERPASALKEVVENSIDAGARRIVVEVSNGGFDLISVTDNGCGIYEDDLAAVFVKHATSKLESAEDLDLIQTLGFRGEALSSIAAVSRVKLTTRQVNADSGVCVVAENGEIVSKEYVTANVGTRVEIRDLFYNTPARKKFLKSEAREGIEITKFVAKLILTNPNLEITYSLDGKTVYKTKGAGLSEAIFAVYGADCLSNCVPVSYAEDCLQITGFVGNPEYTKANSTYQTLSVNGRLVSDKNVQGAIARAFDGFLMTRKYPFFVLDLTIPFNMVDVNVHPRKTEVRFQNSQAVCGKFFRAVTNALNKFSANRVDDILGVSRGASVEKGCEKTTESSSDYKPGVLLHGISTMTPAQVEDVLEIQQQTLFSQQNKSIEQFADELERTISVQSARREIGLDTDSVQQTGATLAFEAHEPPVETFKQTDIADELLLKTRVLGSAFRTYLILELDDKVIFVDQHAAHERILFDKFLENKSSDMQTLMFPYVFTVKEDEAEFIERNIPNILRAGVEVEPFGKNTFRICAVSTLLADTKMDKFVQYLLADTDELEVDDRTLIVEKIAKKACKAAVKAGYTLNELEIRYILKAIYENKVLQCPHGRPVTVVFTKTQLEKMFKRIV